MEPRSDSLIGAVLTNVRQAELEMVFSFEMPDKTELHLICAARGDTVQDPETGAVIPRILDMVYQIGTGALVIMSDAKEIRGEAREIIGKTVTAAHHNPKQLSFGLAFGAYSALVSPAGGLQVLYTKVLDIDFARPLIV